jgi:hypothetical protein
MKFPVKIPSGHEVLITIGQQVDFETPLLKKHTTVGSTVPLSNILQFPPEKIFLNLKKFVGEKVKKGDLLAEHKTFFSTKQYISEFEGLIKEVNHQTGTVTIETASENTNTINCFFVGEVTNITEGYLELNVKKYKEYEIHATHYFGGETLYVRDTTTETVTEEQIDNKILCTERIQPYDQVKYETLGVKSFITLEDLNNKSSLPRARVKQKHDLEEILNAQLPYCIIGHDESTIVFYE